MEQDIQSGAQSSKPRSTSEWIVYLLSMIGGYYLFYYLGITGLVFLAAILGGIFIPNWYFKNYGYNNILFNIIAWSNLVLGLFLPPLGIFVSISSIKIYTLSEAENKKSRFLVLGIIGLILSVINALLGLLINL